MNLSDFTSQMEEASQTFNDDRTAGSILALHAVIKLLPKIGLGAEVMPLVWLLSSLVKAETGQATKSSYDSLVLGVAVAAIEFARNKERNLFEAARICAACAAEKFGMQITAEQLIEVRKNIRKGRASPEMVSTYWKIVSAGNGSLQPENGTSILSD